MKQYSEEFFASRQASARKAAGEVVPLVVDLIRPRSVIDVGCAMGEWLSVFGEHGVGDVYGIDGDYVQRGALLIPQERFRSCDLTTAIDVDRRFDLAVSLEVAEHLPESSAADFVNSLVKCAPIVLFSAAIPYQGGTGHLNEQWQDYWAAHFQRHGYVVIDAIRKRIWSNRNVPRWYKQNMLIYADPDHLREREGLDRLRREHELAAGGPINLVHPDSYMKKARPSVKKLLRMIRVRMGERLRFRRPAAVRAAGASATASGGKVEGVLADPLRCGRRPPTTTASPAGKREDPTAPGGSAAR